MGGGRVQVRWERHEAAVLGALRRLLAAGAFADVTLCCQGRRLRAHRLLLSACSPLLQRVLLDQPCGAGESVTVILQDVVPEDMRRLLDLMYTGGAEVPADHLPRLLRAAEALDIGLLRTDALRISRACAEGPPASRCSPTPPPLPPPGDAAAAALPQRAPAGSPPAPPGCPLPPPPPTAAPGPPQGPHHPGASQSPPLYASAPFHALTCESTSPAALVPPWTQRQSGAQQPQEGHGAPADHQAGQAEASPRLRQLLSGLPLGDLSDQKERPGANSSSSSGASSCDGQHRSPTAVTSPRQSRWVHPQAPPPAPTPLPAVGLPRRQSRPHTPVPQTPPTGHPAPPSQPLGFPQNLQPPQPQQSQPPCAVRQQPPDVPGPSWKPEELPANPGPSPVAATDPLRKHKCEECGKLFRNKTYLKAHARTHTGKKPHQCAECGKSFSQLRNYKYHVSVHAGTREFAAACPECGKVFNDRGYLGSHMKIHRNRKEYACAECGRRFNQRVAYSMHMRIHTGERPHACEVCGKAFARKMLLKQHMRTHTGEKPFTCEVCGKQFADRSNMALHLRLHSGIRPYSCGECGKAFTKKHHLKSHTNVHTGLRPYACDRCGARFSQSSNMRTHRKRCSAAEPRPGGGSGGPVARPAAAASVIMRVTGQLVHRPEEAPAASGRNVAPALAATSASGP